MLYKSPTLFLIANYWENLPAYMNYRQYLDGIPQLLERYYPLSPLKAVLPYQQKLVNDSGMENTACYFAYARYWKNQMALTDQKVETNTLAARKKFYFAIAILIKTCCSLA